MGFHSLWKFYIMLSESENKKLLEKLEEEDWKPNQKLSGKNRLIGGFIGILVGMSIVGEYAKNTK